MGRCRSRARRAGRPCRAPCRSSVVAAAFAGGVQQRPAARSGGGASILRRLADVAIVEADHARTARRERLAELVVPEDHLRAEPHDQQHRRVGGRRRRSGSRAPGRWPRRVFSPGSSCVMDIRRLRGNRFGMNAQAGRTPSIRERGERMDHDRALARNRQVRATARRWRRCSPTTSSSTRPSCIRRSAARRSR